MSERKVWNNGDWTESRFNSFVKGGLRSVSQRWPPKYSVLAAACIGTQLNPESGRMAKFYVCSECKGSYTAKNVQVDHIEPIVPTEGFSSWDDLINRLFCEAEGLQVVCKGCHSSKTQQENKERREYKKNAK